MKTKKQASEKTLKRKLDELYSTYIRKSAADHEGYITCYCGVKIPWQDSDNSHYIPRGCLILRYDIRNTHPSCRKCNRFRGGNIQAYSIYLEKKYGQGILQELQKESKKIVKNFPYEELIAQYQAKLKDL